MAVWLFYVGGGPGKDEGAVAGHSHSEAGVFGPAATEDSLQTRCCALCVGSSTD